MRNLLNMTRVFAGIVFVSAFALVVSSIDPVIWNSQSFWFGLKFFIFVFELLFLLIGYAIAFILGYDDAGAIALMDAIHTAIFGGNETIMGIDAQDLLTNPLQLPTQHNIIDSLYGFLIIVALAVALISGLGFLRDCNPAISAISFFAMNIVLGLAALNDKLLISMDFDTGNLIQMVFSKLIMTAFMIYFALELSFQAGYIYSVIGPNIQRHKRISMNIKRLKEFEMPLAETRRTTEEEDEDSRSTLVRGKNTSAARLKVTTAFSQFRGMVGKKLFKISAEEDWDKMNNRLKTFYSKLEVNDPLISVSLSASSYTPSLARLILIITSGTLFRMVMLLLLSWLALNPVPILRFLNMPDSIITSIESGQPEMILVVLAPLSILFMLIGLIVQFIQRRASERMEKLRAGPVIHSVSEEKDKERRLRLRRRSSRSEPRTESNQNAQ